MKKKTASIIRLRTNFCYYMVEVVAGFPFLFSPKHRKFFLNSTPYSEPTLTSIGDFTLEPTGFRFSTILKSKVQEHSVDYGKFREGPIVGELIKRTNEGFGFNLGLTSNNDIEYQAEDDGISLQLSNRKNESIHYAFPQRRIIHVEDDNVVPAEVVNSLEGNIQLKGSVVRFLGKTVKAGEDFELLWALDFTPEIVESVLSLVAIIVKESQ